MKSRRTRDFIRKIAEDENLTIKQVEEIVYSFFKFTSNQMEKGGKYTGTYNPIRLFKFGIFSAKQGRINRLNRRYERFIRDQNRSSDNLSGSVDDQGVQENLDKGPIN